MLASLTTKAACAAAALAYALTCCPSAIAWSWPASGAVLRPFVVVPDEYAAGQHRGVDLAGSLGEPVLSPAAGVARFAGTLPLHGRSVTIETADGFTLTLLHLGSVDVARGAVVGEGDRLGTLGSSGEAEHDVPYLHLGIRRTAAPDGYVDPLDAPARAPRVRARSGARSHSPGGRRPGRGTAAGGAHPGAGRDASRGRGRRGRRAFVSGTGSCAGPRPARFARDTRPAAGVGGEGRRRSVGREARGGMRWWCRGAGVPRLGLGCGRRSRRRTRGRRLRGLESCRLPRSGSGASRTGRPPLFRALLPHAARSGWTTAPNQGWPARSRSLS